MKPKRVLLVDDNREFLTAAKRYLREVPGLELVGEATSGEQALLLTAALDLDLVLLDMEMRGMTGVEATIQIKRQPDAPTVIVMTAHHEAGFRWLAEKAGADGFVQKEDLVTELPRLLAALFPTGAPLGKELGGLG